MKTKTKTEPAKLWSLYYRGQKKVTAQPYPVCVGEKNRLMSTGNFFKQYFEIKPHQ